MGSKTLPHKVGLDDDVVNFCEADFDPLDCIELVAWVVGCVLNSMLQGYLIFNLYK